jgi:hypothetical protein
MKRPFVALPVVAATVLSVAAPGLAVTAPSARAAVTFKNCKALNARYPHGVGRVGARDHTSGEPVTTFRRSNRLYRANKGHDGDHDGIACEKK